MDWTKRTGGQHFQASSAGYVVAHFKVNGRHQYRASLGGKFLHSEPFQTAEEAKALCERHHKLNAPTTEVSQ